MIHEHDDHGQPVSVLALSWTRLPEEDEGGMPRRFLDFVVDGTSLFERLGGGRITLLGWLAPEQQEQVVKQFMLQAPFVLAEGRMEMYVCHICGDIGCGTISAVIKRQGDRIIWSDFAFYGGYDYDKPEEHTIRREGFEDIGPFIFDAEPYAATFERGRQMLEQASFGLEPHEPE
jgi:hypothetical protein